MRTRTHTHIHIYYNYIICRQRDTLTYIQGVPQKNLRGGGISFGKNFHKFHFVDNLRENFQIFMKRKQ